MANESNETIEIVEICPNLGECTESEYEAECNRLEWCYAEHEGCTPYRVYVRPRANQAAPGTYIRTRDGLQILGCSVEIPDDLQDLRTAAFNLFAQGGCQFANR